MVGSVLAFAELREPVVVGDAVSEVAGELVLDNALVVEVEEVVGGFGAAGGDACTGRVVAVRLVDGVVT